MTQPLIALLTDFGTRDHYVGVMKGVMTGICPDANFIDITHEIPPQDVRAAAFTLMHSAHYFPAHTVFLVVVDPGVGTARHPIIARIQERFYIAPDNGVLSYVPGFEDGEFFVLANEDFRLKTISRTFHGRDIFSPAAAYRAAGHTLDEFGNKLENPIALPKPLLEISEERIRGEVLYIDHFGNIVTSIGQVTRTPDDTKLILESRFSSGGAVLNPENVQFRLAEHHKIATVTRSYNDVDPGGLVALLGSSGFLEISINQGNAAHALDVKPGDPVRIIGDFTVQKAT